MPERKKLKVLIIPSWYSPVPGGITGTFINDFLRNIKDDSLEIATIYMDGFYRNFHKKLKYAFYKLQKEIINDTPFYRYNLILPPLRTNWSWSIWKKSWLTVFKKYTEINGLPDLIHSHGINGGIAATAINKKYDIPFIHTEHSSSIPLSNLIQTQLKSVYSNAKHVTAVSNGLAKEIEDLYGISPTYIPNFVHFELFPLKPAPPLPFTIISIGSPAIGKGMDTLIEAFIKVHQKTNELFHLILVDEIDGIQPYLDKIRSAGLSEQVNYAGIVEHKELHKLFGKSHLFVSASRGETFGLAIVEALACGLPAICTRTQGTAGYFDQSMGKMIDPGDSESLAESILNMAQDYEFWDRKSIANSIRSKIDNEQTKYTYLSFYEQLSRQ